MFSDDFVSCKNSRQAMNKFHLGGSKMLINSGVLDSFSVVQHDLEETMDHGHGVRFVDRDWVMTPNITGCS